MTPTQTSIKKTVSGLTRPLIAAAAATLIFCISACTNTVKVSGNFPTPLVEKLPVKVGLYFSKEFKEYTPVEVLYQDTDWEVPIGYASQQMFEQVFLSMTNEVIILDKKPEPGTFAKGVDLIIAPEFTDFGILDPDVTPLEFFSVSFKYRVKVTTPQGMQLADWEFNSYGKASWRHFNEEGSVREALITALRDAAATLAIDFRKQPGIASWLASKPSATVAEATIDAQP